MNQSLCVMDHMAPAVSVPGEVVHLCAYLVTPPVQDVKHGIAGRRIIFESWDGILWRPLTSSVTDLHGAAIADAVFQARGTYRIRATFAGDSTFSASVSEPLEHVVQ